LLVCYLQLNVLMTSSFGLPTCSATTAQSASVPKNTDILFVVSPKKYSLISMCKLQSQPHLARSVSGG
jgi:hypothetical protein